MVPRGGIEPPTLRFSVLVLGSETSSRNVYKNTNFNALRRFYVLRPAKMFQNFWIRPRLHGAWHETSRTEPELPISSLDLGHCSLGRRQVGFQEARERAVAVGEACD